jgi:hypothetical protein
MKKTIVKSKLILRKQTTRVLRDENLAQVGAGQDDGNPPTKGAGTCLGQVTPEPK